MSGSLLTRREFSMGLIAAGGSMLLTRRATAAEFKLRQFHNQPPESPLHKQLSEMWAAVKTETNGRVDVQTFPENDHIAGGDPAALSMIVDGSLDFLTLNGGLIGTVVPAANVQSVAFAFRDTAQVFAALDGDLGEYLRREMSAKGIYAVPKGCFDNGFQQLTCRPKPIRTAADLQGLKVRTPDSPVYIELFKALGATPVPMNIDKMYASLKEGIVEAQTDPLTIVELFKLYEVQKYVSLTSHVWGGFNLIANLKTWQKLPADARGVIERNTAKYVRLQRAANQSLNDSLRSKLTDQGMTFNEADKQSFRALLGAYYAHWKQVVGPEAWSLLEAHTGKLG